MHLFFSDLDGTLLNENSLISQQTQNALNAYIDAGHIFIITSGRPYYSIQHVMKMTGLDSYSNIMIISNNGSLIFDSKSGETLADYRLSLDDLTGIMNFIEGKRIHNHTYLDDLVLSRHHSKELDFYTKRTGMKAICDTDIFSHLSPTSAPHKAVAISFDKKKLIDLKEEIQPLLGKNCTCFFSCNELLEFIDARSGKGNAIKLICNRYHVSPADVYAAGDADNDISMLEAVGHSIAMRNATDAVKAIASTVTKDDNRHDGLAPILFQLASDPV